MRRDLLIFLIFFSVEAFSTTTKKVFTEYTYYAPESMALQQAKEIALNRAKIQSVADEFGTSISQTNYTRIQTGNGNSTIDFQSIGLSDLRGEWIETTEEPIYDISYSDGLQIVKVEVKGIIRSIDSLRAKINAKILRNKPEIRFESSEFRNNDDLYVSFCSPIDGYLAIYFLDNEDNAFCLLPYARQTNGFYNVMANKDYLFFSKEYCSPSENNIVDEYTMNCEGQTEYSKIVIIFSDKLFVKSNDIGKSDMLPRQLNLKDFNIWLAKSRALDYNMQVLEIPFTIIP